MDPNRSRIYYTLFRRFIDSFKSKQSSADGTFKGSDLFGNKFYEVPAEPHLGKRTPRRWFEPEQDMNFDVSNMSAEWDAWLRLRRDNPPTIEELTENMNIAQMKKVNAEQLKAEGKITHTDEKHSSGGNFPFYKEYEQSPGLGSIKFDHDEKANKK